MKVSVVPAIQADQGGGGMDCDGSDKPPFGVSSSAGGFSHLVQSAINVENVIKQKHQGSNIVWMHVTATTTVSPHISHDNVTSVRLFITR